MLTVRDTGTGIPADELPRVFERFHRVVGAKGRTFEGSGIGLALVHELVTLLGGTVSVESAVGRGSTFTVRLPHAALPQLAEGNQTLALAPPSIGSDGYLEEMLRTLPSATRLPLPQRRRRGGLASWWPTTTPTCAITSAACCRRTTTSSPWPTATPRSPRCSSRRCTSC